MAYFPNTLTSSSSLNAANLTGTIAAISGANLTNLPAANLTGTIAAISGANLTNLTSGNLVGALPAISGASLTSLNASNITSGTIPNAQVNFASPGAIGSSTPTTGAFTTLSTSGILSINAGQLSEVTTLTALATLGDSDNIVVCNSSSPFTVTLPSATSHVGRTYRIKSIGTGVITISRAGSDTIDGATTQTLNQYQSIDIASISTTAWAVL